MTGAYRPVPTAAADPHQVLNASVHQALRRDLRRMAETLRSARTDGQRSALCRHIEFLLTQLGQHRDVGKSLIEPAVVRRRPDLEPLLGQLHSQYGRLGWVTDRLRAATAGWQDDAGREAVRGAVLDFEQVLEPVLQHQESAVMPAICAALHSRDWSRVDRRARRLTGRGAAVRRLSWILDGLDEPESTVVEHLLRPRGWHLWRMVGARAARRRAGLLWG